MHDREYNTSHLDKACIIATQHAPSNAPVSISLNTTCSVALTRDRTMRDISRRHCNVSLGRQTSLKTLSKKTCPKVPASPACKASDCISLWLYCLMPKMLMSWCCPCRCKAGGHARQQAIGSSIKSVSAKPHTASALYHLMPKALMSCYCLCGYTDCHAAVGEPLAVLCNLRRPAGIPLLLGILCPGDAFAGAKQVVMLDYEPLALQCALLSAEASGLTSVQDHRQHQQPCPPAAAQAGPEHSCAPAASRAEHDQSARDGTPLVQQHFGSSQALEHLRPQVGNKPFWRQGFVLLLSVPVACLCFDH